MAVTVSVLLYGCTTWMLMKRKEKKIDENNTRMWCFEQILEATPDKTAAVWPPTSYLTNHPSKMNKTCKGTAGEVRTNSWAMFYYGLLHMDISVLVDYKGLHQLCANTKCSPEELPRMMVERHVVRESLLRAKGKYNGYFFNFWISSVITKII